MKRLPVVFAGHGSPMLALEHTEQTERLGHVGARIIEDYGMPKAILAVSAHWYTRGTWIQSIEEPTQLYDMYGFPKELYDVKYPVKGYPALSRRVQELISPIGINDEWGIDHGSWTVLLHMFPKASIPVVQLSDNGAETNQYAYDLGRALEPLRDEGILIFGSGNIVHNLSRVEWNNEGGTKEADEFDAYIVDAVVHGRVADVIQYQTHRLAKYAAPTPDHFLPLLTLLGAAGDSKPDVFNSIRNLGSISMTSFIWH